MPRADFRLRITKVYPAGDLTKQIEPKMRNLGLAIGGRAQRLVPKRTWALHDSIYTMTEATGTRVVTEVGMGSADVRYGLLVEKGTSRMRAQPFMRPALLQSKAGDFRTRVTGLNRHGVVEILSQRERRRRRNQRRRDRYQERKWAERENREES